MHAGSVLKDSFITDDTKQKIDVTFMAILQTLIQGFKYIAHNERDMMVTCVHGLRNNCHSTN